ncbi:MAG TPA: thioredoxin domain-containing protein [Bryobacteraceae bacterium]|nr:thioredoxin domain-containing protein [Bryobacteraceae bacterium]
MNRLSKEKSPYLLQHANNPVDWYPWGEEAFEKSARENKPIFLSVGYSTCHWCHVMEHESFEDQATAALLNQYFVPVKVDREERPDVDRVYMLFVQASTGSGGWPMSVWLTPERKPFYGGTYFPPDNRFGRPGFRAILQSLAQAWKDDRAKVEESGAKVIEQLKEYSAHGSGTGEAGKGALDSAFYGFRRMFDSRLGGFGGAPKFPRPSVHNFLLRYYAATKNEEALEMVLLTLREMAKGGMNDQLGGGFHRYSVDERWFVPHFEKMLYDQAQIAASYLEAFQITRDGQYAASARDVFSYVMRDLTHPDGGFFSAEDADSKAADSEADGVKREGAFYVWGREEIEATLGPRDAEILCIRYGVEPGGNVAEDPHGEFGGQNILYQARSVEETAAASGLSVDETRAVLRGAAARLLDRRARRPRPHLDDKILAAWNGMMMSAFAKGAQALGEDRYADAAAGAANFVRARLWDESRNVLLRRFRDGESAIDGFLDDYACSILGFLDLYETRFEPEHFHFAARLAERAIELFEDREGGGFFSTGQGAENLVLRLKDDYDGAEPSGNSMMTIALLRLARMTGREHFRAAAERTLAAFSSRMTAGGAGVPQMLVALTFSLGKPMEIVLAGPPSGEMLAAIRRRFLPNAVVARASEAAVPMPAIDGKSAVYVCSNYACNLPVTEVAQLDELLE